jgi:hypothetical protein
MKPLQRGENRLGFELPRGLQEPDCLALASIQPRWQQYSGRHVPDEG